MNIIKTRDKIPYISNNKKKAGQTRASEGGQLILKIIFKILCA